MKLLFRNQAYRLLTLSRFFNAFGASIFNLVFIVYASTLPQASFAVAMANIVMLLPNSLYSFCRDSGRLHERQGQMGWSIAVCFRRFYFLLAA